MVARMTPLLVALLALPGDAAALTDPTAPPAVPAAEGGRAQPAVPLTAIKRVGGRRVAVIGGQDIAEGGRYQDARVVHISESRVVLRRGGETMVLELYPQVEKRLRSQ